MNHLYVTLLLLLIMSVADSRSQETLSHGEKGCIPFLQKPKYESIRKPYSECSSSMSLDCGEISNSKARTDGSKDSFSELHDDRTGICVCGSIFSYWDEGQGRCTGIPPKEKHGPGRGSGSGLGQCKILAKIVSLLLLGMLLSANLISTWAF